MQKFDYTINDPMGLHARPAGIVVKAINKVPCNVKISYNNKTIDGKRLFAIMSLGVTTGETITVTCEGECEKETADLIKRIFVAENL
jgi:phosphocarrier protein